MNSLLLIPIALANLTPLNTPQPYKQNITINVEQENWVSNHTDEWHQWNKVKYINETQYPNLKIQQRMQQRMAMPLEQNTVDYFTQVVCATKITTLGEIQNFSFKELGWASIYNGQQANDPDYKPEYKYGLVDVDTLSMQQRLFWTNYFNGLVYTSAAYNSIYNTYSSRGINLGTNGYFGRPYYDSLPPESLYEIIPTTLAEDKTYILVESYIQYYNTQMLEQIDHQYVQDFFANVYMEVNLIYDAMKEPPANIEVIDIPTVMFTILTLPFTFLSQAFNLVLFPNTWAAINVADIVIGLLGISIIIVIIRIIFTLKG